jgi:hypothetical protein
MIEEGKITSEEGIRLLEAMGARKETNGGPVRSRRQANLRVTVKEASGEKLKVFVPLPLAAAVLSFLPESAQDRIRSEGLDLNGLRRLVADAAETGPCTLLTAEKGGRKIVVAVE